MSTLKDFETGCCPRFHPEVWQEKEIVFKDKLFLKDHVNSLFHIPLNFGKVMERNRIKIEKADARTTEQLVLSDDTSPWGEDIYIAVEKEIPQADIKKISGTFLTKVFEGPYGDMGKFVEQMKTFVKSRHKEIKKLYFHYAYCPKCSKAYGKNYIMILAQI